MAEHVQAQIAGSQRARPHRGLRLLVLLALYYLMPLFVMLTTSVKTLDEIRGGNLLSLPAEHHLRSLGEGLVERLHRRRLQRPQEQFLELRAASWCRRC